MAEPVTILGGFLTQLFSAGSLAGVIGNLVASHIWEGKWVDQFDAIARLFAQDNRNNHDLLRALRRAECQAMVLICDRLLRDDYGLRADFLPDQFEIWLRRDPELNTLCQIRRAYDRTYKDLASMSVDYLARMHGATVANIPELIKSASECFKVTSAEDARKNLVDQQISFVDQALRVPPEVASLTGGLDPIAPKGLPAKLKSHLEQHPQGWWDMIRLALREELKNNQPAQIAWQMDVLSALPEQLGANYQEFEKKFDAIDAKLDGIWDDLKQLRHDFDGMLGKVDDIQITAHRIEAKVDDITQRLDAVAITPEPPRLIPDTKIRPLLDTISKAIKEWDFGAAERTLGTARETVDSEDEYGKACIDVCAALIAKDRDHDAIVADTLLTRALSVFDRLCPRAASTSRAKSYLAEVKAVLGDFGAADSYANDCLNNATKDNNLFEMASAHILFGYIATHRHDDGQALAHYEEAGKLGATLCRSHSEVEAQQGAYIAALANQSLSAILPSMGRSSDAQSRALQAAEEHRKLGDKPDLARVLVDLANFELAAGNHRTGKWKDYIDEAKSIFLELKDYGSFARCVDVVSRAVYGLGQKQLALHVLKDGYEDIKETGVSDAIAFCLERLGLLCLDLGTEEEAATYLTTLIEYAKPRTLDTYVLHAYERLADIAEKQGDIARRDEFLGFVLEELDKSCIKEQSDARRAYVFARLGQIQARRGNTREALRIFEGVANSLKSTNDLEGYARATLTRADLHLQLGGREFALACWRDVEESVRGTTFYRFAAAAKMNIGRVHFLSEEYAAAQRYLEDAQHLVSKYSLQSIPLNVEQLLDATKRRRNLSQPAEKPFSQIVHRLYEGITGNKIPIEPLVRYWYYRNEDHLYRHLYNLSGLKTIVFCDDISIAEQISQKLSWLFENFFVVSKEVFPTEEYNETMYPYDGPDPDEQVLLVKAGPTLRDFVKNPPDEIETLQTGLTPVSNIVDMNSLKTQLVNPELVRFISRNDIPKFFLSTREFADGPGIALVEFGGWGLPQIAYEFFKKKTAAEIVSGNVFVLNVNSNRSETDLYSDIVGCWGLGCLPVYLNDETTSQDVAILGKVDTSIPFGGNTEKSEVLVAKKLLNSLWKAEKDTARASLNDLKWDFDNLFIENTDRMPISIALVEFEYGAKRIIYPVIYLHLSKKPGDSGSL